MSTPHTRLHVLLGAGGVGKTTLAAGYALALARAGRRVGLLGIDPSRRLQGALGIELPDLEVDVPVAGASARGQLRAALLRPELCMRRWAAETCTDEEARTRLTHNAFFVALADRLATSTDLLAAVRVAEWAERDAAVEDLVVDTAPGLDAIEFLRRPQRLTAFLEGHLVSWLRSLATSNRHASLHHAVSLGEASRARLARRVVGGLARISGTRMLLELADFLSLAQGLFAQMLARTTRMQRLLASADTEILLVTTVREDAARGAQQLADALASVRLAPSATIVNRAVPPELEGALAQLPSAAATLGLDGAGAAVTRYAKAYAAIQNRGIAAMRPLAPRLVLVDGITVPQARGAGESSERLEALATVGEQLRVGLQ